MSRQPNYGAPEVPTGGNFGRQAFDEWVRNSLLSVLSTLVPPGDVSNVRATALAAAIQVDFTRSDGDGYSLYWNTTASLEGAVRVDLGTANKYVDTIGDGLIKRWYLIRPRKGLVEGNYSPWVSQTTLAIGTAVTPPTPPPASDTPTVDQETDSIEL